MYKKASCTCKVVVMLGETYCIFVVLTAIAVITAQVPYCSASATSHFSLLDLTGKPKCSYFLIDFTSTSLTWRKSLASKDTAAPCTGESSSMLPSYAMFVLTANATCFD